MKTAAASRTLGLLAWNETTAKRAAARAFAAARAGKRDTAARAALAAADAARDATAAAVKLNRAGLAGEGIWETMRAARAAAVAVFHFVPADALAASSF